MAIDFTKLDTNTIMRGKDANGVKYLQLFLTEYTNQFGGKVNPGCAKCIANYLSQYKTKMQQDNLNPENSGFVLKKVYHGLQTNYNGKFTAVTNEILTDDLVKHLTVRPDFMNLFSKFPDGFDKETYFDEKDEETEKPKRGRKKKTDDNETEA